MEGISDILSRKNFDEPPEATAIKKFVYAKYKKSVVVTVRDSDILIACQGASFTAALRMQWRELRKAANTDKRLIFHIA